jgi:alpha-galactosidase
VYGDHVELTRVVGLDSNEKDLGRDFESTAGTGGVVGTKFIWPAEHSPFKDAILTSDKDTIWKKWIAIYNQKMLPNGTFRNLYVYGYDSPEGYAIEKDGRMYHAFFDETPTGRTERLELRGLVPGAFTSSIMRTREITARSMVLSNICRRGFKSIYWWK